MLPKNLKFQSKVESAISRSYRTNIQPQNGTGPYQLGDTITVNIPTRANLVLVPSESYLKFTLNITSGAAANNFRFDSCGAHGVIQRIRVWSGSNLLQDIDNYGLLAKIMYDMQLSTDSAYGKMNVTSGTRSDLTASVAGVANVVSVNQTNSGDLVAQNSAVGAGAVISQTYCINLISLMGSLCSQNYFPLFAATSAPIRIELQLTSAVTNYCAVAQATLSTSTLTGCEYVAQFIELGDQAMQMIYGSLGAEPLQFVVPDWRNYQYTASLTNAVSTQVNMPIPAKFSSLKALICTTRDKGTGATTFFPYSSVSQGINNYQFRLGSQVVPSKPPDSLPEMFMEVQKSLASISDLAYQPSIERVSYSLAASTASVETGAAPTSVSSSNSGSFYVGLDLENYSGASKDTIFSGYNSNTDDIYWTPTFTSPGGVASCRFDAFANFDTVVVCENGTAYVKF